MRLIILLLLPLGLSSSASAQTPATKWSTVTAGLDHVCALTVDGRAFCWGKNDRAQLGTGSVGEPQAAPTAVRTDLTFTAISAGDRWTCGLDEEGAAHCWGRRGPRPVLLPARFGDDLRFRAVQVSSGRACGITLTGEAYCDRGGPGFRRLSIEAPVSAAAAGDGHVCAIDREQRLRCLWEDVGIVDSVSGQSASVTSRSTSYCVLSTGGEAHCAGVGRTAFLTPVSSAAPFVQVSTGYLHACGIDAGGRPYCWGRNLVLNPDPRAPFVTDTPVPVDTDLRFSGISAGLQVTCAISVEQEAYCWGSGTNGLLGSGTIIQDFVWIPIRVADPDPPAP